MQACVMDTTRDGFLSWQNTSLIVMFSRTLDPTRSA